MRYFNSKYCATPSGTRDSSSVSPYKKHMLSKCLVVAASLFLSACKEEKPIAQMPSPLVTVERAVRMDVPFLIEAPAKVSGSLEIQIRSQVNGILKARLFKEGQYIEKGEKLFEIDKAPYEAALKKASGNLAQAESEFKRSSRDYERVERLFKVGAVSRKEHDDVLSSKERADANVKMAEASLNEAQINLGYTDVKAPISGIVRKEAQSIGNLVSSVGESGLLTSMVQTCPLHINFSVSGTVWNSMAKRQNDGKITLLNYEDYNIEIITSDGTIYPEKGKIIFVDSSEDNITSSVSIKVEVDNTADQRLLLPGQFVRVRVVGATYNDAIVIPSSSLISTQKGFIVYVVKPDKIVEARPVKAEIMNNNVIIWEGIQEGESVVSEGIIKARPGTQVNPVVKSNVSSDDDVNKTN